MTGRRAGPLRRLLRDKGALVGLVLVGLVVLMAAGANLAPWGPKEIDRSVYEPVPPGGNHPLGTDGTGYDVFSRLLYGARISLMTGLASVLLALLVGVPLGAISGYAGGKVDTVLMRIVDVMLAFPSVVLAIAIAALGGAILMFVTGCVKFDRVGRALSGKVIVLVAASIAIGSLVLETGAAAWLGDVMALFLQYLPPAAILAAIMLFVTLLTNFASNATAATIGTPIAFNIANTLNLPEEPLILAVLFGCNLCYATPIAYQTNMLIMGEGGYKFGDYIRTGVPLVLLMVTTLSILLVTKYGM